MADIRRGEQRIDISGVSSYAQRLEEADVELPEMEKKELTPRSERVKKAAASLLTTARNITNSYYQDKITTAALAAESEFSKEYHAFSQMNVDQQTEYLKNKKLGDIKQRFDKAMESVPGDMSKKAYASFARQELATTHKMELARGRLLKKRKEILMRKMEGLAEGKAGKGERVTAESILKNIEGATQKDKDRINRAILDGQVNYNLDNGQFNKVEKALQAHESGKKEMSNNTFVRVSSNLKEYRKRYDSKVITSGLKARSTEEFLNFLSKGTNSENGITQGFTDQLVKVIKQAGKDNRSVFIGEQQTQELLKNTKISEVLSNTVKRHIINNLNEIAQTQGPSLYEASTGKDFYSISAKQRTLHFGFATKEADSARFNKRLIAGDHIGAATEAIRLSKLAGTEISQFVDEGYIRRLRDTKKKSEREKIEAERFYLFTDAHTGIAGGKSEKFLKLIHKRGFDNLKPIKLNSSQEERLQAIEDALAPRYSKHLDILVKSARLMADEHGPSGMAGATDKEERGELFVAQMEQFYKNAVETTEMQKEAAEIQLEQGQRHIERPWRETVPEYVSDWFKGNKVGHGWSAVELAELSPKEQKNIEDNLHRMDIAEISKYPDMVNPNQRKALKLEGAKVIAERTEDGRIQFFITSATHVSPDPIITASGKPAIYTKQEFANLNIKSMFDVTKSSIGDIAEVMVLAGISASVKGSDFLHSLIGDDIQYITESTSAELKLLNKKLKRNNIDIEAVLKWGAEKGEDFWEDIKYRAGKLAKGSEKGLLWLLEKYLEEGE